METKTEQKLTKRKAPPHAFKPGTSGNLNGRPKKPPEVRAVEQLTRKTAQAAIDSLLGKAVAMIEKAIAEGMKPKADAAAQALALRAAESAIDRSLGKSITRSEVLAVVDGGNSDHVTTPDEMRARLAGLIQRLPSMLEELPVAERVDQSERVEVRK